MSAGDMDEGVERWIQANIFSLVSALGGPSVEDGHYRLGHEALSVFKDLKRWNRAWDLEKNRHDVARACAEANLVKGDLLEILAAWSGDEHKNRLLTKASLYSTDLLTILTWPMNKDENAITAQSLTHGPFLEKAQASYKRAILHHDHVQILKQTVRVCLPSLAIPRNEREGWDDNIIKVVLFLYRNIAAINEPDGVQISESDNEISRHVTIDAFHRQDVFNLLLTIGSGIADDFDGHDTELLDVLFQICKGIDVDRLFMDKNEVIDVGTRDFQALIAKEKSMHAAYLKVAPTRHSRFGTMMWLKRGEGRYSTVFGQTASNEQTTLQEMDKSKKWKRPRRPQKKTVENPLHEFDTAIHLSSAARKHLRGFVEQFLDSSFNPLFHSLRRSIESEQPRVLDQHRRLYFFMISWLLRAERARRRKRREDTKEAGSADQEETESFALVASVLNHETFVLLSRSMQSAADHKMWQDLTACMRCFTEILHTVQEMLDSPLEDDQEIAENTLNRIFYEQTTHDRIVLLLRSFKDQGFGYLDACTDLAHTFIRLLERYSKQNVDMQVRTIRRVRRKKKAQAAANGEQTDLPDDRALEQEDVAEAQRTSTERGFDFKKFAARFVNQSTIETFAHLLRFYKELNTEQLKRAHRFLYRAAFKMDLSTYLLRMDYIQLMHKMIKGPESMNKVDPTYKDWEQLVQQIFRKLVKRMQERPVFAVEVLFSKIPNTVYYLEHGVEREVVRKAPRAPAELEVKPGMDRDQQIGVAVAVLVNQTKSDDLAWVKRVLNSAADEREAWTAEFEARGILRAAAQEQQESVSAEVPEQDRAAVENAQPFTEVKTMSNEPDSSRQPEQSRPNPILVKADTDARRSAMAKDKYLRLLLSLLSFHKLEITDSDIDRDGILTSWTIPSDLNGVQLRGDAETIARFEFSPPSYDDGRSAEDFVRNKVKPAAPREGDERAYTRRRNAELGQGSGSEDSEGASDVDEELFPPGGPPTRPLDYEPKKSRRKRNHHSRDELIPDSVLDARRDARRKTEREKAAKIKSELFISLSDDEDDLDRDRLFFEREARLRENVGREVALAEAEAHSRAVKALEMKKKKKPTNAAPKQTKKRKASSVSDEEDDDENPSDAPRAKTMSRKRRRASSASSSASSTASSDGIDSDVELDLPPRRKRTARLADQMDVDEDDEEGESGDETDTPPSSQRPSSGHGPVKMAQRPRIHDSSMDQDDDGSEAEEAGSDKENAGPPASSKQLPSTSRAQRRKTLVVDSDDE